MKSVVLDYVQVLTSLPLSLHAEHDHDTGRQVQQAILSFVPALLRRHTEEHMLQYFESSHVYSLKYGTNFVVPSPWTRKLPLLPFLLSVPSLYFLSSIKCDCFPTLTLLLLLLLLIVVVLVTNDPSYTRPIRSSQSLASASDRNRNRPWRTYGGDEDFPILPPGCESECRTRGLAGSPLRGRVHKKKRQPRPCSHAKFVELVRNST